MIVLLLFYSLEAAGAVGKRDSSGSEVTVGDESMSGYFEPFGKAIGPPAPVSAASAALLPPFARDSIASTESDLEAILGTNPSKGQGCPLHKTHPKLNHSGGKGKAQNQQQQPKQLRGILKGGTMNGKITTNPVASVVVTKATPAQSGGSSSQGGVHLSINRSQRHHLQSSTNSKTVVVEALDV